MGRDAKKVSGGMTHEYSARQPAYEASRQLKSLNVTKAKLLSHRKKCRIAIVQAEADIIDTDKRLAELEEQLQGVNLDNPIVVSEHAILRYLARHKGLDLDEVIRGVMKLPPDMLVQKGNTIVTIIDDQPNPNPEENRTDER